MLPTGWEETVYSLESQIQLPAGSPGCATWPGGHLAMTSRGARFKRICADPCIPLPFPLRVRWRLRVPAMWTPPRTAGRWYASSALSAGRRRRTLIRWTNAELYIRFDTNLVILKKNSMWLISHVNCLTYIAKLYALNIFIELGEIHFIQS